ncbi:MAG TPA: hypothetical protein VMR52_02105 [Dehalococcoidia bacterium]|nr:hypothetical protein [Dehalococcoidia bacterium]
MARMRVADFMALIEEGTLAALPAELRESCVHRVRFVWFQVHFHSPKVHYEVCLTRKTERIEIGLHFEGPRDFSYRWAELIAPHMAEIQAGMDASWELEEWTASWTRLHTTIPYDPPSPGLAAEIAETLARLITVCQPVIERERENVPAGLEAEAPKKHGRGRFERRRQKAWA